MVTKTLIWMAGLAIVPFGAALSVYSFFSGWDNGKLWWKEWKSLMFDWEETIYVV